MYDYGLTFYKIALSGYKMSQRQHTVKSTILEDKNTNDRISHLRLYELDNYIFYASRKKDPEMIGL